MRKSNFSEFHMLHYLSHTRSSANVEGPCDDGVKNGGQIPKELQGLENAGLENDGQTFSKLRTKSRGLENAGLEK